MRGLKRGLDLNDSASPRVMARDVRNVCFCIFDSKAQGTKSLTKSVSLSCQHRNIRSPTLLRSKTKRTALRERRDVCPIPKEHGQLHIFILNLPVIV